MMVNVSNGKIMCVCLIFVVHLFLLNRTDMSLTSILSAEAIENAVKDCQGIIVFLLDWTCKTSKNVL